MPPAEVTKSKVVVVIVWALRKEDDKRRDRINESMPLFTVGKTMLLLRI
jgi:hypothetical protein